MRLGGIPRYAQVGRVSPSYTIEAMMDPRGADEPIVGTQIDSHFGSIVMVRLGGVLTEPPGVTFTLASVEVVAAHAVLERMGTSVV